MGSGQGKRSEETVDNGRIKKAERHLGSVIRDVCGAGSCPLPWWPSGLRVGWVKSSASTSLLRFRPNSFYPLYDKSRRPAQLGSQTRGTSEPPGRRLELPGRGLRGSHQQVRGRQSWRLSQGPGQGQPAGAGSTTEPAPLSTVTTHPGSSMAASLGTPS